MTEERKRTSVDDAAVVNINDGVEDSADERSSVRLVVVPLSADAVKQLAAGAKIETKVHIV